MHVQHLEGSYTSENLRIILTNMLHVWNIDLSCCHAVVTNNGPNIIKAVRECQLLHIVCVSHTLQLVIKDAIFAQWSMKDVISIAHHIVAHFKHCSLVYGHLKIFQNDLNLQEHHLVQDVVTRWNSTYLMLECLLEQKNAISI